MGSRSARGRQARGPGDAGPEVVGADEEAGRDARHDVLGLGLASLRARALFPILPARINVTFPDRLEAATSES